ncbi:MAG: GAF domain-containing sensor histidine kinase [Anaerolineae bacterium]|nr:GAF domain-containing sensor histidine kinase [Anaerolineae bacterium]
MTRRPAAARPPSRGAGASDATTLHEAGAPYDHVLPSDRGERLLACLARSQAAVASACALGKALDAVLEHTLAGLGWEAGAICLLGPAEGLAPDAVLQMSSGAVAEVREYAVSRLVSQRPVALPVMVDPDDGPGALRATFRHIAFAPVFLGGARPEGVLVAATAQDSPPSRADALFLEATASLLASAVEREVLRASSDYMRTELEALQQVSLYVSEREDVAELLKSALVAVEKALQVSACAIYELMAPGKSLRCLASRNVPGAVVRAVETYAPSTPAHRALKTGAPVMITRREDYTGAPQVVETAQKIGIQSAMIVPVFVGGQGFGVLSLYHLGPREWTDAEIRLAQMLAASLGSALSRTQSRRRLAEYATRLRDLHHISVRLMESPDAEAAAILAADAGRGLCRADAVAVYEQDRRYGLLKLVAVSPAGAAHFPMVASPGRGVWGRAAADKKPVFQSLRLNRVGFQGFACALPLQTQDGLIGVLTVLRQGDKGPFDEDEADLLGLFANLSAAAIQKARLLAQSEELGILKERTRIATEMHDSVGGDLAAILVKAQLARKLLESDPARAAAEMDWIVSALQGSVTQMRRVLHALRPVELEQQGFVEALRRLVDVQAGQYGIPVTLEMDAPLPRLGPRVEGLLYRAANECLNNIRKHAAPRSVRVALRVEGHRVALTIVDDGRGFDPAAADLSSGMGLRTLAQNVAAAGGELEIDSAPGKGARVTISLPYGSVFGGATE